MINRAFGRMEIVCDSCEDETTKSYSTDDFDIMVADARSSGWVIQPVDGGAYHHTCPDCQRQFHRKAKPDTNRMVRAGSYKNRMNMVAVLATAINLATFSPAPAADYLLYNGLGSALPFVGRGMRQIKSKMIDAGFEAREFAYLTPLEANYMAWYHAQHFCDLHLEGKLTPPMVLGGHSYGGEIIAKMARQFQKCGISVDYMFFIDTPIIWPIGDNVDHIDNFRAGFSILNGRVNLQDGVDVPIHEFTYPTGHVTVSWLDTVHQRILEMVEGLGDAQ